MKKNLPITNSEVMLKPGSSIISMTDLKGAITYVNKDFIDISGFTEDELIGMNHNVIRHPDMPSAAFEDLWDHMKAGKSWRGMVKNRCKNGDHYWVEAFVSPVIEKGKVVGYQSVRNEATREQIKEAEELYARLNKDQGAKIPNKFRLGDVGIMKRIGVGLFVAGVLPFVGDSLWGAGLVGDTTMVVMALMSPVILIALAIYIYLKMFKPMQQLVSIVSDMASGHLDKKISHPYGDELGELYNAVRLLQARFRTVVGQISEVSIQVAGNTHRISSSSSETFRMMAEQQQSTSKVNDSMMSMRDSVQNVASNTIAASQTADQVNNATMQGKTLITDLKTTVENLVGDVENSADVITELDAKSQNISSILEVIRSIAEQTNLLALNAAIEAARAGEQGRGFAVVADEVRTLAGRTADATEEINQVIEELQQGIGSAVRVMGTGQQTADQATGQSADALQAMDAITSEVDNIRQMNGQIADAANMQLQLSESISGDMANITSMAGTTLSFTQGNAEAGNQLMTVTEKLLNQFSRFGVVDNLDQLVEQAIKEADASSSPAQTQNDDVLF